MMEENTEEVATVGLAPKGMYLMALVSEFKHPLSHLTNEERYMLEPKERLAYWLALCLKHDCGPLLPPLPETNESKAHWDDCVALIGKYEEKFGREGFITLAKKHPLDWAIILIKTLEAP